MLHKRNAALVLAITLPALAGCVQATRHSNTMVFGTNTTVGLKVGQDVNQMPEVLVAYDRQEAVIMPLLANVAEKSSTGNSLSPCDPVSSIRRASNATSTTSVYNNADVDEVHPCKFVGIRQGNNGVYVQDSYSVLASFGARIEGNASQVKGTVGIAQYFATGVAAQNLAISGGAAVVAVGTAAENAADNEAAPIAAAAAAGAGAKDILDTMPNRPGGITLNNQRAAFLMNYQNAINSTSEDEWSARWTTFAQAVAPGYVDACPSKSQCQGNDEAFDGTFYQRPDDFISTARSWCRGVSKNPDQECPKYEGDAS